MTSFVGDISEYIKATANYVIDWQITGKSSARGRDLRPNFTVIKAALITITIFSFNKAEYDRMQVRKKENIC